MLCASQDYIVGAFKWISESSFWKGSSPGLSATQQESKPAPVEVCVFTLVGIEPGPRMLFKKIALQEV